MSRPTYPRRPITFPHVGAPEKNNATDPFVRAHPCARRRHHAGVMRCFRLTRDGSPMVYEMSGVVEGGSVSGVAKAMGMEAPWAMTKKQ